MCMTTCVCVSPHACHSMSGCVEAHKRVVGPLCTGVCAQARPSVSHGTPAANPMARGSPRGGHGGLPGHLLGLASSCPTDPGRTRAGGWWGLMQLAQARPRAWLCPHGRRGPVTRRFPGERGQACPGPGRSPGSLCLPSCLRGGAWQGAVSCGWEGPGAQSPWGGGGWGGIPTPPLDNCGGRAETWAPPPLSCPVPPSSDQEGNWDDQPRAGVGHTLWELHVPGASGRPSWCHSTKKVRSASVDDCHCPGASGRLSWYHSTRVGVFICVHVYMCASLPWLPVTVSQQKGIHMCVCMRVHHCLCPSPSWCISVLVCLFHSRRVYACVSVSALQHACRCLMACVLGPSRCVGVLLCVAVGVAVRVGVSVGVSEFLWTGASFCMCVLVSHGVRRSPCPMGCQCACVYVHVQVPVGAGGGGGVSVPVHLSVGCLHGSMPHGASLARVCVCPLGRGMHLSLHVHVPPGVSTCVSACLHACVSVSMSPYTGVLLGCWCLRVHACMCVCQGVKVHVYVCPCVLVS